MADLLVAVEDRLDAILRGGRGQDGSLGPDALARSIPANRYRRAIDGASLRDVAYPANALDRAYWIDWLDQGLVEPQSQTCNSVLVSLSCDIVIGHLYGAAHTSLIRVVGSESAAVVALYPRRRVHGDLHRIRQAVTFARLHGHDTDPSIVSITQRDRATIEDLGDRLISTLPLDVVLRASGAGGYEP